MTQAKFEVVAEDRASRVLANIRQSAAGVVASFGTLATVGAALGGGAIVAAFRSIVSGVDQLNDARDATGATIENLSALEDIAVRTGTSFDTATGTLVRFNQALANARPGDDVSQVFERLGLSVDQLRQADPVQALQQTAVALRGFADDGNKARAVQELFGRSIRETAPLLNDLAEAGTLTATVTTEQVQAAEAFNKSLSAIGKKVTDIGRVLASELLPVFQAVTDALANAGREGGLFRAVIGGLRVVFETIAVLGANVVFVFQGVGREIAAIAAQLAALARLDFDAFRAIGDAVKEDGVRARAELDQLERRILGIDRAAEQAAPKVESQAKSFGVLADAAKRSAKELALFRSANEGIAGEFEARELVLKRQNDELERLNELLGRTQTEALRADIDRLNKAFFDGTVGAGEYDAAIERLLGRNAEIKDQSNETADLARQIGLSFTSAFEDAVVGGRKLSDVLRGLLQDLLRLAVRQQITQPLFNFFNGVIGGGAGTGGAGGTTAPASAGSGVRAAVANGGAGKGITVVYNVGQIGSGVTRADVVSAMEQTRAATIGEIADLQQRGRFKFA